MAERPPISLTEADKEWLARVLNRPNSKAGILYDDVPYPMGPAISGEDPTPDQLIEGEDLHDQ